MNEDKVNLSSDAKFWLIFWALIILGILGVVTISVSFTTAHIQAMADKGYVEAAYPGTGLYRWTKP